jgi:ComF family protein
MLYPARCPVCGDIVVPKTALACEPCKNKLKLIAEPKCKKCGKPMETEENEYCRDCMKKDYHFITGYSVWQYDSVMKKSVSDFKYNNKKEYAAFYIHETARLYGEKIRQIAPDIIVPVPIHRLKYRERGYNQADILARGIGKSLDIPVISDLLIRNRKTLPQKQLNDKERLKNLREAFEFNKAAAGYFKKNISTVLLVDDIYTTGSTIEACTNVLIDNGISSVYFITLCIGKGY